MSFSIILPTLNEKGHILNLIDEISIILKKNKVNFEIIVVDDDSNDGTYETVKKYLPVKNFLKLISRKNKKKNLALSINEGIKLSKFQYVIWMDADFQHPPQYIEKFIEYSKKYDAIIASRFLSKSERYFNKKKYKKEINENQSYLYNKICRFFFFKDITDYTSGFVCVKRDFFQKYYLKGFYGEYFVDLIVRLKKNKRKICEIPFRDRERATGFSKTAVNLNLSYFYTCFRYFTALIKIYISYKISFD